MQDLRLCPLMARLLPEGPLVEPGANKEVLGSVSGGGAGSRRCAQSSLDRWRLGREIN